MKAGILIALVCTVTAVGLVHTRTQKADSVDQAVKKLYSEEATDRDEAKKRLLHMASGSSETRGDVIEALLKVLDDPDVTFRIWGDVAGLLGDLRATEALDRLIRHLDYNDGTVGFSAAGFPALKAVIGIGEAAVPKLEDALAGGQQSIRSKAAIALGAIGGNQSRQALIRASETETDEEVKTYIRNALLRRDKQ